MPIPELYEREKLGRDIDEKRWLAMLWEYLNSYVQQGAMTPTVAREIYVSQIRELHPEPVTMSKTEYVMKPGFDPKRLLEPDALRTGMVSITPPAKTIAELEYFPKVQSYFVKRVETERRRIEDLVEEAVGRWQAQEQRAFESLEARQAWGAEVSAQRRAVAELGSEQRARALAGAFGKPLEPERPAIAPEAPEAEEMFGKRFGEAAGELPFTAQRYFAGRFGNIYEEFERAFPGARAAWWKALNAPRVAEEGERREARLQSMQEQLGVSRGITERAVQERPELFGVGTEAWIPGEPRSMEDILLGAHALTAVTLPGQISELAAEQQAERAKYEKWGYPQEAPKPKLRDPWEAYLERYPFMAKFVQVPRQYRGFTPSRYAPPARWSV